MNLTELNELTRDDLVLIDDMLLALAKYEHAATGNTTRADLCTRAINRIAARYGLVEEVA